MEPARTADFRQHLEVETPEHVTLDLEIAGVGSRALAAIVDTFILGGLALALLVSLAILGGYGVRVAVWASLLLALAGFAAGHLYFILFEGLRAGQTPGKRLVGIRVVMDTGHPVTVGAAVARNLLRLADFLPPPYLTGSLLAAFHPQGKRLGDLVAGTVVVRDRPSELPMPSARARAGVAALGHAAVGHDEFGEPDLSEAALGVLARFEARRRELAPAARVRLATALIERLGVRPPPGVDPVDHLVALHARGVPGRRGAFAARKGERWDQFQHLADRAAARGLDGLAAGELPDFAARYREVAADLARARTYRADPPTIARLERLVAAGHNLLYRDERHTWRRAWRVIARDCPAAVLRARAYVLVASLAFLAPAAGGFALLRERPGLAAELLPEAMLRRAEAGAARAAAGRKYVTVDPADRPLAATAIIGNNARIAVSCFAGGVFLGVGSLVLLAYNGLAIGASAGHFANLGLLAYLLEFTAGHGPLELFAIWVAGAAGFLLGRTVVAPGELSRSDALVLSGRVAVRMVGATLVLLVVAGLIEGFVSTAGGGLGGRLLAGAASLGFLALYLAGGRTGAGIRPRAASSAS